VANFARFASRDPRCIEIHAGMTLSAFMTNKHHNFSSPGNFVERSRDRARGRRGGGEGRGGVNRRGKINGRFFVIKRSEREESWRARRSLIDFTIYPLRGLLSPILSQPPLPSLRPGSRGTADPFIFLNAGTSLIRS